MIIIDDGATSKICDLWVNINQYDRFSLDSDNQTDTIGSWKLSMNHTNQLMETKQ